MKGQETPIVAMILAGGRVDELSVLTLYRPKAAVPFGGLYRVIDFPLSNLIICKNFSILYSLIMSGKNAFFYFY